MSEDNSHTLCANHCQREPVTQIAPHLEERQRVDAALEAQVSAREAQVGAHEAEFHPIEEDRRAGEPWMGPVADTVLADFAFYGLLAGIPVLFCWLIFGQWWVFRNAQWIAIALFFWFVALVGWRRYRANR